MYPFLFLSVFSLFLSVFSFAENDHSQGAENPAEIRRRIIQVSGPNINWAGLTLSHAVALLDASNHAIRLQADLEIRRRLLANYRETALALPGLMAGSQIEGRRRIEAMLAEAQVSWPDIFERVKASVIASSASVSARDVYAELMPLLQGGDDHLKVMRRAGFEIIQNNEIPGLENLVVSRGGRFFRVQFLGKGSVSVTRVARNGADEFVPMQVKVDFGRMLTPLQRASLGLGQDQKLPAFTTTAASYAFQTQLTLSLGGEFVGRTADFLISAVPAKKREIRAARDQAIAQTFEDNGEYPLGAAQ